MSQVIMYGELRRFQIESLIHNTQSKFILNQIQEAVRVLCVRLFHAVKTGTFYTNESLAESLLNVHLNGKIRRVEIKDRHVGSFECETLHSLFDQVLKNIQSKETKGSLETRFKTKESSRDEWDEMKRKIDSGEIVPIAYEPHVYLSDSDSDSEE